MHFPFSRSEKPVEMYSMNCFHPFNNCIAEQVLFISTAWNTTVLDVVKFAFKLPGVLRYK